MQLSEIYDYLRQRRQDKKLIVFAGAGLSLNLQRTDGKYLPDWKELVGELLGNDFVKSNLSSNQKYNEYVEYLKSDSFDYSKVMDILDFVKTSSDDTTIKDILPELIGYVDKKRNEDLISKYHSLLLKISNDSIITTNYDNAFEVANPSLRSKKVIWNNNDTLKSISQKADGFLFKLHGDITNPQSIILFNEDYTNIYADPKNLTTIEALNAKLSNNTILFVGYSLKDYDIGRLLQKWHLKGVDDYYFLGHKEPKLSSVDFSSRWIKVEADSDKDILKKNYKIAITNLYDALTDDDNKRKNETITYLHKKISNVENGRLDIVIYLEDIAREFSKEKSLFSIKNQFTDEILNFLLTRSIKAKFIENEEFLFDTIYEKLKEFTINTDFYKDNTDVFVVINEISNYQNITDKSESKSASFDKKYDSLLLLSQKLPLIPTTFRDSIHSNNFIQNNLLTNFKLLKEEIISDYLSKEDEIFKIFQIEERKPIKHYTKLSYNDIIKEIKISENDLRIDFFDKDILSVAYNSRKLASSLYSLKFSQNIRFSIITDKNKQAIGFIDKQIFSVAFDVIYELITLENSLFLIRFNIENMNSFKLIDLVEYFSKKTMLLYDDLYDTKKEGIPTIFVKNDKNQFLSYKDVLNYIITIGKNEPFFNTPLKEFFNVNLFSSLNELSSIDKIDNVAVEQYMFEKPKEIGMLVSYNDKVVFLNFVTYYCWLRLNKNEANSDGVKIQAIHENLLSVIKNSDNKKNTFIISLTKGGIDSFDINVSFIELIKFFAKPETLEVAILRVHHEDDINNIKYYLVTFDKVFQLINEYFSKL